MRTYSSYVDNRRRFLDEQSTLCNQQTLGTVYVITLESCVVGWSKDAALVLRQDEGTRFSATMVSLSQRSEIGKSQAAMHTDHCGTQNEPKNRSAYVEVRGKFHQKSHYFTFKFECCLHENPKNPAYYRVCALCMSIYRYGDRVTPLPRFQTTMFGKS